MRAFVNYDLNYIVLNLVEFKEVISWNIYIFETSDIKLFIALCDGFETTF